MLIVPQKLLLHLRFDQRHQLVQALPPTRMKAHLLVILPGCLVFVHGSGRIFCAIALSLKGNYCREKGILSGAVARRQRVGEDNFFRFPPVPDSSPHREIAPPLAST